MTDSTRQAPLFDVDGKTVTVWADGSYQDDREFDATAGYGCVIKDEDSGEAEKIQGQVESDNRLTPQVAEYKAILNGIERVCDEYSSVGILQIYSDAKIPVNQIDGEYDVSAQHLLRLQKEAHRLLSKFDEWHIDWRTEAQSSQICSADELAQDVTGGEL